MRQDDTPALLMAAPIVIYRRRVKITQKWSKSYVANSGKINVIINKIKQNNNRYSYLDIKINV